MAHVLVLSLVFPPDGVSTGVIVGELCADLRAAGHAVTVISTTPHYNLDTDAEVAQPLARVWGPLLWSSDYHGARVLHVRMPRKSSSILLRLLAWSRFHVVSVIAAARFVRRVDVILAPSPPLTVGACAWALGRMYRAPFIYNVQELYPDIAITLGAIKRRGVASALFALERFVYARASRITAIAPRMRRRIIAKGVPPGKVRLIPNFVDLSEIAPRPKSNTFSRRHGLDREFVVSYAGNMGPAQGLDAALDAASILRDEGGLKFLFIGEGSSRAGLEAEARARGLENVVFLPHEPYGVVPDIYGASDLCLVPLAARAGADAVPSKVYRIMASARPVLACSYADTDLADLVAEAKCGIVVPPGAPDDLARAVTGTMRNPAEGVAMGQAGRAHVTTHYSRESVSAQYESLVREVIGDVGAHRGRNA